MTPKDIINIKKVDKLTVPEDAVNSDAEIPEEAASHLPNMPASLYATYRYKKFRLLREAKLRLQTILLERDVWNVLWQVDGKRTVEEIAENLLMPLNEVIYHIESLRMSGVICSLEAVFLPDFIYEKTNKAEEPLGRRKEDFASGPADDIEGIEDVTEIGSE